jgi:hypothetical protein
MTAQLAVCNKGRIGIVERVVSTASATGTKRTYVGHTLDGARWRSANPRFLNEVDATRILNTLVGPASDNAPKDSAREQ